MKKDAKKYNPVEVEEKWQAKWLSDKVYSPELDKAKKPFYNLMMFPYPSAEGMHVGNMYAFTGADVYGRFQRMKGNDVFEPFGLDGFGIHSENYALKIGKHPMDQAKVSEANFYRQMQTTGISVDWERTVETYNPDYYMWTQWLFTEMFKAGLAYRKKASVNFCPSCKTVLADEQVIDARPLATSPTKSESQRMVANEVGRGKCERCGTLVEKRDLEQWFFRITSYAERLLNNIPKLDWTEKVKIAQTQWIGKKTGINISYEVENIAEKISVFTTRPDTNFGATFIALAPEHPLVSKLTTAENKTSVEQYVKETAKKSDIDRQAEGKEKTGVFTGAYAINQLTGYKMPIWVSDFVLMGFGTGALVGVPGHDKRDFEFASKFGLEVLRVVVGKDKNESPITTIEQVQEEEGTMVNSQFLDGINIYDATEKIMDYMEEKGYGKRETTYHLRDWLISRQRYWGPPIPMIYCQNCADQGKSWFTQTRHSGDEQSEDSRIRTSQNDKWDSAGWYPEEKLPVKLPHIDDYKPLGTGGSPLANHPEFYEAVCPSCAGKAKRETDVSDTFLDSAWYFLRYISVDTQTDAFDIDRAKKWLPVNMYIGGAEHSVLHLLYSRFVTMFLKDKGLISFEEPFTRFFAHGLIIKDGAKMSKSKGNVVVPDEYIKKFGADTLRLYLMFLGPFNNGGDFRDTGIEGMSRFVRRVWTLIYTVIANEVKQSHKGGEIASSQAPRNDNIRMMHKTIKKVTEDLERLHYNTAISSLMEWYNFLSQEGTITKEEAKNMLLLLAPFAPHITEELWEKLRVSRVSKVPKVSKGAEALDTHDTPGTPDTFASIHKHSWPISDNSHLQKDQIDIAVQINGRVRAVLSFSSSDGDNQQVVEKAVLADERVKTYLNDKKIRKIIFVKGKIINLVVS